MVQELLDFKEKLDVLIEESFIKNEKFVITMKVIKNCFYLCNFPIINFKYLVNYKFTTNLKLINRKISF